MNLRAVGPTSLVDINHVQDLDRLEMNGTELRIGAAVRQRAAETDPELLRRSPMLIEGARSVASVSVRNRGTVVGSIAHAEPAAEWPTMFVALDGSCSVQGPAGAREISAADLFVGRGRTSVAPDELITHLTLQLPEAGSAWLELSRRTGDFPVVGVGAVITRSPDGRVTTCAVGVGGVGEVPVRVRAVEQALVGSIPTDADLNDAAHLAGDAFDPPSDVHGSASYRRKVAPVMIGRTLQVAYRRSGELVR
jgi:aerobic carbon-monoxide dehydrogenase medium subunit